MKAEYYELFVKAEYYEHFMNMKAEYYEHFMSDVTLTKVNENEKFNC